MDEPSPPLDAAKAAEAAREVDTTLLDWTATLSPLQRLDAAYRAGIALDQLRVSSRAG